MPYGRWRDETGACTAEQVAVIVIVGAVIAALLAIALPDRTAEAGEQAVDCLFSGDPDCFELAGIAPEDDDGPVIPPGVDPPRPPHPPPPPAPEVPPGVDPPSPPVDQWPPLEECIDLITDDGVFEAALECYEHHLPDDPWPEVHLCHELVDNDDVWEGILDVAECGHFHDSPTEYWRAYQFQVGDCIGSVDFRSTSFYFGGARMISGSVGFPHGTSEGCGARVRVEASGTYWQDGWSEWGDGFQNPGDLVKLQVEVTEPDGTVTIIDIAPHDGHDMRDPDAGEPPLHQH